MATRGDSPGAAGPSDDGAEHLFSSTTFEWRRVKIRRPPEAHSDSRPKAVRWRRLPPRPARESLTVTVVFRGGPECWYEVRARGSVGRFPGYVALHDVMEEINGFTKGPTGWRTAASPPGEETAAEGDSSTS